MTTTVEPKVQSTKSISTMTPEERAKYYSTLRERMQRSRLEVKGKPGIHYLWAHKTDDAEMIRLDTLGYTVVKEPNPTKVLRGEVKPEIEASGLKEDGTYVIGDVILVQCPQEVYDFLQLDIEEQHRNQVVASTEEFKTEAAKQGVPTFETSKPRR